MDTPFQLKTFQLNDLSNCPFQLNVSRWIQFFNWPRKNAVDVMFWSNCQSSYFFIFRNCKWSIIMQCTIFSFRTEKILIELSKLASWWQNKIFVSPKLSPTWWISNSHWWKQPLFWKQAWVTSKTCWTSSICRLYWHAKLIFRFEPIWILSMVRADSWIWCRRNKSELRMVVYSIFNDKYRLYIYH